MAQKCQKRPLGALHKETSNIKYRIKNLKTTIITKRKHEAKRVKTSTRRLNHIKKYIIKIT